MSPRGRDQTRFIFPLGSFDLPARPAPPAAPPVPAADPVEIAYQEANEYFGDIGKPAEPAPELRTVYDDDQRPPGIDAEDETDPPDEGD